MNKMAKNFFRFSSSTGIWILTVLITGTAAGLLTFMLLGMFILLNNPCSVPGRC